jgi:hypothetical protein
MVEMKKERDILSTDKLYVFKKWKEDMSLPPPEDGATVEDIQEYVELDSFQVQDLIVNDNKGNLVVAKVSRRKALPHGAKEDGKANQLRKTMKLVMKTKPTVSRGEKTSGIFEKYVNFGFRKEPLKSGELGVYAFKPNVSQEVKDYLQEEISMLALVMEKQASHFVKERREEYATFRKIQELLDLPTLSASEEGTNTQLSVARNHWARAHRDRDYFYTFLSCLSADVSAKKDEVIYYFCFPEYKIAVPLRSGDVIVFNPLTLHCCSNSSNADNFIWSAYVSEKTVMTAGIGILEG